MHRKQKRPQNEEHGRSKKLGMVFLEDTEREREREELDPETRA